METSLSNTRKERKERGAIMPEESFVYTCCPGWGDHDYCAIKTIVKDGKIVRAEKTVYPNSDLAVGHICQKGLESIKQPYSKDRLLYPLKRAGARGEGKWEQISWEQALDEIAEKLLAIRDQHGPEALSFWNFIAGVPPMFGVGQLLASRFMSIWGATDCLQSYGLDNGPQFAAQYTFNNQFITMSCDPRNLERSDLIIIWGANPVENQMRVAKYLIEAREQGAKIIDIGLVFDATAGLADEFIPIKPGTDTYLALAIVKYLIDNNLCDVDYLVEKSVSAYLADTATGLLYKDAEGNYAIWDEQAKKPVAVAKERGAITAKKPALYGAYSIDGKEVSPVFQLLVDHVSPCTLESAETVTGVPVATIIALAEAYAQASSPYIMLALGLRYQNQGESYRAMFMLATLIGSIGKQSAGIYPNGCSSAPIVFNNVGIARAEGVEPKTKFVRQKDFYEQVLTGKPYPVKAMIVTSGNPAHNCPNRSRWQETFDAMDLVVDIDIWMTDTGELADYVLPDCMPFERTEILDMAAYGHIVLQEPAIEPQGEAKDMNFFFTELAKRVGMGEYFNKTTEEWLEIKLQSDFPTLAGIEPPLTMERLKKEKLIPVAFPAEPPFDSLLNVEPPTETGRIEFYCERLLPVGLQLPTYLPTLETPTDQAPNETFPYQFFTGRQRFFMQSMFTDDPLMIELSGEEPSARMNPIDAEREGIVEDDMVEVYNDRGHVVLKVRLEESVPPGTVHVWFGWRQRQYEDGTYAELLVPLGDESTTNATGELWYKEAKTVYGEDDMGVAFATGYAGGWDTIWDCACAVRKVEQRKGA
jgi:molybdopterin-containing oxidoreductase family molybdopterin binding subunit